MAPLRFLSLSTELQKQILESIFRAAGGERDGETERPLEARSRLTLNSFLLSDVFNLPAGDKRLHLQQP